MSTITTTTKTTEERPPTPNPLTLTCHCGQARITVPHKPKYLNECRCTVCYKYGALWGYYPRSSVRVSIIDNMNSPSDLDNTNTNTNPEHEHDDAKGRGGEDDPKPKVTIQKYIRTGQTLQEEEGDDNPPRQYGSLSFDRCSHCGCVLCWDRATPFSGSGVEGEVDDRKMGVNFRMVAPGDVVGMRWLEGVERFVSSK